MSELWGDVPDDRMVIIIGRGHSGTRAVAKIVQESGVSMPTPRNGSWDFIPKPNGMYGAAQLAGQMVEVAGDHRYDFSRLVEEPIPPEALALLYNYVHLVITQQVKGWIGWKLPESTLCYPWLVRLLPRARFIWWLRDPRDCILAKHGTDDLEQWGVSGCSHGNNRSMRARSWLYQEAIVRETPKPRFLLRLTMEEWAADQLRTLRLLRGLIPGSNPRGIPVNDTTLRWRREGQRFEDGTMELMRPALLRHGWAV